MALMTGKPVYTDDIAPKDCLIVKVLRSPHAHAWIEEIDKTRALSVPGIETILTWEDSPQKRFTMAGQTYPEPSPYDRLILVKLHLDIQHHHAGKNVGKTISPEHASAYRSPISKLHTYDTFGTLPENSAKIPVQPLMKLQTSQAAHTANAEFLFIFFNVVKSQTR